MNSREISNVVQHGETCYRNNEIQILELTFPSFWENIFGKIQKCQEFVQGFLVDGSAEVNYCCVKSHLICI